MVERAHATRLKEVYIEQLLRLQTGCGVQKVWMASRFWNYVLKKSKLSVSGKSIPDKKKKNKKKTEKKSAYSNISHFSLKITKNQLFCYTDL